MSAIGKQSDSADSDIDPQADIEVKCASCPHTTYPRYLVDTECFVCAFGDNDKGGVSDE